MLSPEICPLALSHGNRCVTCYPNKLRALPYFRYKAPPTFFSLCKFLRISCYTLSFFCKLSCRQLQFSTTLQRQSDMDSNVEAFLALTDFGASKLPIPLSCTILQDFGSWVPHNVDAKGNPSYLTQYHEGTGVTHRMDMPLWVTVFHILLIVYKQPAKSSVHRRQN